MLVTGELSRGYLEQVKRAADIPPAPNTKHQNRIRFYQNHILTAAAGKVGPIGEVDLKCRNLSYLMSTDHERGYFPTFYLQLRDGPRCLRTFAYEIFSTSDFSQFNQWLTSVWKQINRELTRGNDTRAMLAEARNGKGL